MTARAAIGHNMPPDPLDEALAPFGDHIAEAENWLDGGIIETEAQMNAADELLRQIKDAEKAVRAAEESAAKPLYDAWKAAKARFAPTLDDLGRIRKGLIAALDGFKRQIAAAKEEAARLARAEAERKMREAERAAATALETDIAAQREAARARDEAEAAIAAASAADKDTVRGLRTVTRYEIGDERAALHWIAGHDRPALSGFVAEYVRQHHKKASIAGVRVWTEKEAF